MTRLFLCEKPSQARDIAKVLGASRKSAGCLRGNGIVVTWGFGHLLEQAPPEAYAPEFKRWSLDSLPILPSTWKLEVKPDGKKQFGIIRKLLTSAAEVVVATDADREGEVIAREILEYCGYGGRVSRLWLSALDDASIRQALAELRPGEATYPLYQAGLGRSRADWLVGMNLTRAYTVIAQQQGHQGVLSVGRVQTPTLRLVVDRDRQIEVFVPRPFWVVIARLQTLSGQTFQAKWRPSQETGRDEEGRCLNETVARDLMQRAQGEAASVIQHETQRKRQAPPLVMDLATLQQEASRRWGYGAQQVLDAAQALYETHKATTYPRTDCRYLPVSQWEEAQQVVTALQRSEPGLSTVIERLDLSRRSRVWNDRKITAHHGIIPTRSVCDPARMSEVERHLYDLVVRHYLAQFLAPYEFDQTDVTLTLAGEAFVATGRQVRVPGWRELFPARQAEEGGAEGDASLPPTQDIPPLRQGERCMTEDVEVLEKHTVPPKPYTEGTLIAAMKNAARFVVNEQLRARLRETAGIGTEATRAKTIEVLLKRQFLRRQGRALVSTATGQQLVDSLPGVITDPGMTALWEQALDDVAERRMSLQTFMQRQSALIEKLVQHAAGVTLTSPDANRR